MWVGAYVYVYVCCLCACRRMCEGSWWGGAHRELFLCSLHTHSVVLVLRSSRHPIPPHLACSNPANDVATLKSYGGNVLVGTPGE